MSWREILGGRSPMGGDRSDGPPASVTSVSTHPGGKTPAAVDPAEISRATSLLNETGVRLISLDGAATVGAWSDLDGPEVRAALRVLGNDALPLRYLDSGGIPARFKVRCVGGEVVPMNVLQAMEMATAAPWNERDQLLKGLAWSSPGPTRHMTPRTPPVAAL